MVDRVNAPAEEGLSNTPADNAKTDMERPGWLPENFKDTEDLWKSYQELRKDHTKKSQELASIKKAAPGDDWKVGGEPPKEDPKEEPKSEGDEKKPEDAPKEGEEKKEPATLDDAKTLLPGFTESEIQEISNYAWEHGQLTEEHYEKLQKQGYSKTVVDQFMAGQFAVREAQTQALINAGGGQERVNHMFAWARDNLSSQEIDAYQSKLDQGGAEAILAMESLSAKYGASGEAIGGRSVSGEPANSGDTSVFRSTAQVQEAMSDPRYKKDPAYRRSVEEKIARSNVF